MRFNDLYNGWPLCVSPIMPVWGDVIRWNDVEYMVKRVDGGTVIFGDGYTLRESATMDGLWLYMDHSERDGYECVLIDMNTPPGRRTWRLQCLTRTA